jgi:hypothetical protein
MLLVPTLSQADPRESLEGSIDPLGTYAIADRMAVRLVPGIRERQRHPRFLTTIAVSLSLCSEFEEGTVARDGVSEPWQVFEWLVVEGLVRATSTADTDTLRGLPGRDKASAAINDQVPLSMTRYLKTPTVFGFHGIYRALARSLKIELAGRLGENGSELLAVWQKEQGLEGFTGSGQGRGAAIRRQLVDAIHDSLSAGAVARKGGWAGFGFFRDHLGIYAAGEAEARMLQTMLLDGDGGAQFRHETLSALLTPAGQELWREECEAERNSERRFHQHLAQVASPDLKVLLDAIDAYETFSRLVQDAFDDILKYLAQNQTRIQPSELADLKGVRLASERVPALFRDVAEQLSPVGESVAFNTVFGELDEVATPLEWSRRLLDHHCKIQRNKPPQGRAPWIDRFDDGSTMIRTQYLRNYQPRFDDEYVNAYRTNSLWSFARDLRWVS